MGCECDCGSAGVSSTRRESTYGMTSMEKATEIVLQEAQPLAVADVPAHAALGLVLAAPVKSQDPLPPFRASIMDGYAVVASDGTGQFSVVERIAAGSVPTQSVTAGHVAYITTGSPVPEGADAVVKIEDTEGVFDAEDSKKETAVKILKAVTAGTNVRAIGSDIGAGEVLIDASEEVTAAEIGLLATSGIERVKAHRKPVVGVLSTGSELVDAFQPAAPGKIRDSNRPMLLALLSSEHVETLDLGICRDSQGALEDTVRNALERCDVLITSGGVSMGDHDFIKPLLERIGNVHFGRLFMKPGKPTTFATVDVGGVKKLVFALPGNPVSTFATFHLVAMPAIKRLRGLPVDKCRHTVVHAFLTHPVRLDPERPEFHRATIAWDSKQLKFLATSTGRQISSRLLSCRNANALLYLPTGTEIREGDGVKTFVLHSSFLNAAHGSPSVSAPLAAPPQSASMTEAKGHSQPSNLKSFRAGILTISDRVSAGQSQDLSGPAMRRVLEELEKVNMHVAAEAVVPDNIEDIQRVVKQWADDDIVDLVLTSGGTGFTPRDVTPEAVKAILDKEIPGFVIAMLENSLKITNKAMLARPVAGIRHRTLIVTLPGKPKAVVENFSAIADVLPHALHLVRDVPHEHHRANPSTLYT